MQTKSKTQILSTILSVLISVGLVATAAYATTTIGLSIDTDGNLVVDGNVTLGDAAGDTVTVSGPVTLSGTTATGLTLSGTNSTAAIAISSATGGKMTMTTTAETATDPGRQLYLQRTYTGAASTAGLTGVEVRSTFNGTANSANMEVKGGEFKARHTDGNTYNVGTMKGVIGNVDSKSGAKTITSAWAVEGQIDNGTGSTITTAAGVRVAYNENGTVTNAYGVYVDGTSVWDVGVKITDSKTVTGIDIGSSTTGITFTGTTANAITTSGSGVVRLGSISTTETATTTGAYDSSFKLAHTNNAAITSGRLSAMSIELNPKASTDAYAIMGAEIATYLGTATVSGGPTTGLFVETQGGTGLASDYNSLYVYSAPGANPTGNSTVIRVESNPSTITWVDSWMTFVGDPNFAFDVSAQGTASDLNGDKTGGAKSGWLKVNAGGNVRYIQLYE